MPPARHGTCPGTRSLPGAGQQTQAEGNLLPTPVAWHSMARHCSPPSLCQLPDGLHAPPSPRGPQHRDAAPSWSRGCGTEERAGRQWPHTRAAFHVSSLSPAPCHGKCRKQKGPGMGAEIKEPASQPRDVKEEPRLKPNANLIRAAQYLTDLFTCLPAVGIPGEV